LGCCAVEPATKSSTLADQYLLNGVPHQIKELIREFDPISQQPTTLRPSRLYDHSIPLLPNASLVKCRPYRYSPEHKDKIERQVGATIKSGLIVPSLSPFASPFYWS
jgi:hypothetical protein